MSSEVEEMKKDIRAREKEKIKKKHTSTVCFHELFFSPPVKMCRQSFPFRCTYRGQAWLINRNRNVNRKLRNWSHTFSKVKCSWTLNIEALCWKINFKRRPPRRGGGGIFYRSSLTRIRLGSRLSLGWERKPAK